MNNIHNLAPNKKNLLIAVALVIFFCLCHEPISDISANENGYFEKEWSGVIYKDRGKYIGWPSIAKTNNGNLIIVFSGDRHSHICPWGKTYLIRSYDDGKSWSIPLLVNDTPLDDRDAGIVETMNGTLLISWFTSIAFEDPKKRLLHKIPSSVSDIWESYSDKIDDATRKKWLGNWVKVSTNNGKTWSLPIRTVGSSPHGPIQLSDGRLLYVGKGLSSGRYALTVEESFDNGITWQFVTLISIPEDESINHYFEPHVVENSQGKLIVLLRYKAKKEGGYDRYLRQMESIDMGRSWSLIHKTNMLGYPPHLLKLKNDWLVAVYARRKYPYRILACISMDGGESWDVNNEIVLSDSINADMGYPSSVQLDDGSIFTVYYQVDKEGEKPCLKGTKWIIGE